MKFLKKGFSLAEVLLTLGIIAVIATLGFTATKKSIDNSYNLYIYTGYKGLTDAIAHADYKGLKITENLGTDSENFLKNIADSMNTTVTPEGTTSATIVAPNGIKYEFYFEAPSTGPKFHSIIYSVPYKRFVHDGSLHENLSFELRHYYELGNILLPTDGEDRNGSGINILTRKDLLPFYIDNGIVGRRIPGSEPTRKTYFSWQEAWCRNINPLITEHGHNKNLDNSWSCAEFQEDLEGALKIENPRKAF